MASSTLGKMPEEIQALIYTFVGHESCACNLGQGCACAFDHPSVPLESAPLLVNKHVALRYRESLLGREQYITIDPRGTGPILVSCPTVNITKQELFRVKEAKIIFGFRSSDADRSRKAVSEFRNLMKILRKSPVLKIITLVVHLGNPTMPGSFSVTFDRRARTEQFDFIPLITGFRNVRIDLGFRTQDWHSVTFKDAFLMSRAFYHKYKSFEALAVESETSVASSLLLIEGDERLLGNRISDMIVSKYTLEVVNLLAEREVWKLISENL